MPCPYREGYKIPLSLPMSGKGHGAGSLLKGEIRGRVRNPTLQTRTRENCLDGKWVDPSSVAGVTGEVGNDGKGGTNNLVVRGDLRPEF